MSTKMSDVQQKDLPTPLLTYFPLHKQVKVFSTTRSGELNSESNKLQGIIAEDNLIHRDKEMDKMASELIAEGEVEEITPIDDTDNQDIEDLEDYEYEDV